jgi:hypothetical protein
VWAWIKKYWRWIAVAVGLLGAFLFGRRSRGDDDGRDSSGAYVHHQRARDEIDRGREAVDGAIDDAKYVEAKTERIAGIIHAAHNGNRRAQELLEELRRRTTEGPNPSDGAVDDLGD